MVEEPRVIFCGGRKFNDRELAEVAFDAAEPGLVITGGAPGADDICDDIARVRGIPRVIFPANWNGEGLPGGPRRNGRMLHWMQPQLVVALPGGRGTENMIEQARRCGVKVTKWFR